MPPSVMIENSPLLAASPRLGPTVDVVLATSLMNATAVCGPRQTRERVTTAMPMRKFGRRIGVTLLAASFFQASLAQPLGAQITTRAEYEACQARDEAGFRAAIEALTLQALQNGIAGMNYKPVIAEAWRRGDVDAIINRRVDEALGELREETGWWRLIESLASRDAAQQLASSAAERVYQRSDAVKAAIEGIATAVGRDIGKRIELATVDAAEPAVRCLQAFLGPRYGATVARVVGSSAARQFEIDPARNAAQVSAGQVLVEGSEGLTGAMILLVRRQMANMAARIGQRLVGAVLGRIVSIVGGGIGVVLIAKDVWELRHGVLPIIAGEMKSEATRDKIQDELARAMSDQMTEHLRDMAGKTADRVVEIWLEFRRSHARVLELTEKDEAFRKFLDTINPANLSRLDEVVALVLASEGEPAVAKRLADGTLREAVEKLPAPALQIARDARSLEPAFQWAALAGDALPQVVEHEIHRRNGPGEFTKAGLARILALPDRTSIGRLAALKTSVREPLLELDNTNLARLARALPEGDLEALSGYLTGLERQAGQRLLAAVAQSPSRMQMVASASVRDAILRSQDQNAAVGMMLRSDAIFNPGDFSSDLGLVRDGKVSPWLLWSRYPVALSLFAFTSLIVLLLLWRLVFGRRVRIAH